MGKTLFLALLAGSMLLLNSFSSSAQTMVVNPVIAAPVIDGVMNENEWRQSAAVSGFIKYGAVGIEAETATVHVAYDDAHFYVAVRCRQDGILQPNPLAGNSMWMGDSVELYLQPEKKGEAYYHFAINPQGEKYQALKRDGGWQGAWQGKASQSSDSWMAEIAIPWKTLGLTSRPAIMGANFTRNNPYRGDDHNGPLNIAGIVRSTWSHMTGSYHDPATFGTLIFTEQQPVVQIGEMKISGHKELAVEANIINPSNRAVTVKGLVDSSNEAKAKAHDEQTVTVPAGEVRRVTLNSRVEFGKHLGVVTFTNQADGSTLSSRKFTAMVQRPLTAKRYWLAGKVVPVLDARDFNAFTPTRGEFVLTNTAGVKLTSTAAKQDGIWQGEFAVKNLLSGEYRLSATLFGNDTSQTIDEITLIKPDKPEWLDSTLGMEDKLLPPWTPVRLADSQVSVWGREYRLAESGYLQQATTQGQELLAGEVALHARVDGREVALKPAAARTETEKETRVVLHRASQGEGLGINVRTEVEFDGMVRFDTEIDAAPGRKIEQLYLDIPLKKAASTLIEADPTDAIRTGTFPYWRGWRNGLMPTETVAGSFTPYIWMGNDDVGLVWFAESQKQWSNRDENRVIEVIPQADRNILRIHFIDEPINAGEKLTLTFGLQATPVKPQVANKQFGMYAFYGAQEKRMPVLEQGSGAIVYPARQVIDAGQGSIHVRLAPTFDTSQLLSGAATRDPRGNPDDPIVVVEYPNGDQFGVYYGLIDNKIRVKATTGLNEGLVENAIAEWSSPAWNRQKQRDLTLSWKADELSLWSAGKQVTQAKFDSSVFLLPLESARIRLGGSFGYHAVKATSTAYNGAELAFQPDAVTTLLDNFSAIDADEAVSRPKKAPAGAVGRLVGRWSANDASVVLQSQKNVISLLDHWKARDIDLVHIHERWTETQGYPKTSKHRVELKALADGMNQRGMRLLPYIGFLLGDNSPEFTHYQDEILVHPFVAERGWNRGDHLGHIVSYTGQFQNFMVHHIDRLIRDYGIGGFYMDGTAMPPRDQNMAHGAGYIDRKGKLRPTYPIFEYRQFLKRIRSVGLSHRPDFYMDMHITTGNMTPVSAFGDSIWKGEQFTFFLGGGKSIRDLLNPNEVRASMGRQYGLSMQFLNYRQIDDVSALCAVLNLPLRLDGGLRAGVMNYYGLTQAQWHPYWENARVIQTESDHTYVSYWKRSDGAIVAAVSHLDPAATDKIIENIKIATTPMGALPGSSFTDAITGEQLEYKNGNLKLSLVPWRYRLILIAPPNIQKPIAPGIVWSQTGLPQ